MPVVINEFEVVVENGQAPQSAQPQSGGGQAPPAFSPQELLDVMRHHAERMARIRAI